MVSRPASVISVLGQCWQESNSIELTLSEENRGDYVAT
jgi:hypothetical protein